MDLQSVVRERQNTRFRTDLNLNEQVWYWGLPDEFADDNAAIEAGREAGLMRLEGGGSGSRATQLL